MKSKDQRINRFIFLLLTTGFFLTSFLFSTTEGFVSTVDQEGSIVFVQELSGSGADDNISLQVGMLIFGILLIIGIFRFSRDVGMIDVLLLILFLVFQMLFLIFGTDSSDIYATIFYAKNYSLIMWFIVFLLASIFVVARISSIFHDFMKQD